MRALVVYESMFGNTKLVAEAIGEGLAAHLDEVDTVEVGQAPAVPEPGVDLLAVGGPTHAFTMSRASSRRNAAGVTDEPLVSPGVGIREWIHGLPKTSPVTSAVAFDTRIKSPWLPGSAAAAAHKRLRQLGFNIIQRPQSFFVTGTTGPMIEGEIERARSWGAELANSLTGSRAGRANG